MRKLFPLVQYLVYKLVRLDDASGKHCCYAGILNEEVCHFSGLEKLITYN